MKFFLSVLLLSVAFPNLPYAAPADDLAQTNKELKQVNATSEKLAGELKKLQAKSKELSAKMVKTAAALQASEAELSVLEEKNRVLGEQIEEKTSSLAEKKKHMAAMVQTAVKLSRTPEEAIILMPGDVLNNMKASRAMKMTTDSIKKEAESISAQMAELEDLKAKVEQNKKDAQGRKAELEEQRKQLRAQMAEHKTIEQKLKGEQQGAKAKAQALAKKAEDLQSLIAAIEREKEEAKQRAKMDAAQGKDDDGEELEADTSAASGVKGKLRSFAAAKGKIRIPAAGRLIQKFGVSGRNETSKGITINTRAGAQVTAPYDGEVIFTGPFMEYGKMIILRHSDGFHTLLAGLSRIDASIGDYLAEGEPIGNMGSEQGSNLYMELRSNNQPINPSPWVKGMNK